MGVQGDDFTTRRGTYACITLQLLASSPQYSCACKLRTIYGMRRQSIQRAFPPAIFPAGYSRLCYLEPSNIRRKV